VVVRARRRGHARVHRRRLMRTMKITGQVVALAAVAGLLGLLIWRLTHQTKPPKIGRPAPAFSLKRVDTSGTLDLASLRGKPVVLNFWASWCVPCKGEAKMLEEASREYRSQGVVFLGVDFHDVTGDARKFLEHHGVTYPTVQDGSGSVADRYGVSAVPETYFIDRKGRLVGEHIMGTVVDARDAFRRGVEAALAS
jgi:cytochrome c biogenesis protein CcmG, thiol:disulfide interchange protein DsbE